jgi:hypothetical protein
MGVKNGSGRGTCRDWEAARGFRRSKGELFGSQIQNHRKKERPSLVLGSQALDPMPQACAYPVGKSHSHRPGLQAQAAGRWGRERLLLTAAPAGEPP